MSYFAFIYNKISFVFTEIQKVSKYVFFRNVVAVASGTVAAQGISILSSPLITRLYSPEDFGVQGVFMSISGIMGTVAALTYPVAIVIPESDREALNIVRLSIYIGVLMSIIGVICMCLFGTEVLSVLSASEVLEFKYFIPITMLISVISAVTTQWLIRKKAFTLTAKVTAFQSLVISGLKVCFGFINPSAIVLIVINSLGGLLGSSVMLMVMRNINKNKAEHIETTDKYKISGVWEVAKKHSDFPLLRTPQVLLNAFSHSLPVMLLAIYFGPSTVGYYSIANTVMAMPILLIGGSVMQVFYPRINEAIRKKENVRELILKTTAGLAISGALPFLTIIIAGPTIFSFVFGETWRVAGVYAQWLSVWLFFQYINKPAVSAIPALRLQKGLLIYELFSTGSKVIALYLGYMVYKSDVMAIALFSISGVIAYSWLILWVVFHSGKKINNNQV